MKLENFQPTGAFKLRGAANAILSLSEAEKKQGVVTMSTGNHGKAVAYVAKQMGIKAVICISELVPKVKIDAMKDLGATVVIAGKDQGEATEVALQMQTAQGLRYISAFDDPDIIAGQATIGLEIIEQQPAVDTILVPLSGGGLMSGVAFAVKALSPKVRLIGVSLEREPAIYKSIRAGKIVQVEEFESLADALPGPISEDNQYTFEMCRRYVDDILLVSEEQVAQSMAYAYLKESQVLEGGGAVTLGILLDERIKSLGQNIVAICSGNNVDPKKLSHIVEEQRAFVTQYF